MSAYLDNLINEVEAEAEIARARLQKLETFNATQRSQERDASALRRILQRLEILKGLQQAEKDRIGRRRRAVGRSKSPVSKSRNTNVHVRRHSAV
jgi:hypothetical protein